MVQRSPSGLSLPATGAPSASVMVTAPSTPSSALTVTGSSTVTPTSPSVTEAVSLGINRSANGVPLSAMVCGCGGVVGALPQALAPSTIPATRATPSSHLRTRLGRATEWSPHMVIPPRS